MQPLELSIVDQDGCTRKQWTFSGDLAIVAAKIEAMVRESAVPAKPATIYTLAIRSESFGTLFVDGLNRSGPRIDDRGRALHWNDPAWAWAWWLAHRGDDTRPVEVVHAITGERVEVGESAEAWAWWQANNAADLLDCIEVGKSTNAKGESA